MNRKSVGINKEILRLAIPNIISNITVPLMGIASTAIAGHLGHPTATIGALAIGVSIFNFIYWNCGFLRAGTSGFTSQAYGAKDPQECSNNLARTTSIAVLLGVLFMLLQYPIGEAAIWAMNGDEMVAEYFYARIWAVPAGIILFGLNGWFIGMQNSIIPMCISILQNIVHVVCAMWFCFGLDWGIAGIGYGSVVAQYMGMTLGFVMLAIRYSSYIKRIVWRKVFNVEPFKLFFRVNRDIIIRSICITSVYTFFTAASARMGDPTVLAVNTLLLQLFTLFSYMSDGFAQATEALTGRFVGARDESNLRRCVKNSVFWCLGVSVVFVGVYVVWWRDLLDLFVESGSSDGIAILNTAAKYIGWIIAIPLASSMPFLMDGIMIGATRTKVMRDSMILATGLFFAIFYAFKGLIGNNALWLAFLLYMFFRGLLQLWMTHNLRDIFVEARKPR